MTPMLRQCLEIRERQYDAQGLSVGTPGEWQLFHDTIEDYIHEEGVRNVLRVKRFPIANPPMDGPTTGYVLDMVIESEIVDPVMPARLRRRRFLFQSSISGDPT